MIQRPALLALALAPLAGTAAASPDAFPDTEAKEQSRRHESAVNAGRWDEAVVALVLKLRAEELKKDEGPGDYLRALAKAADTAPAPMRAPLLALTALEFKARLDSHRHEIEARTAGGSGDKLEGWDAARFIAETDSRFSAALANEADLRATPIAEYSKITDKTEGVAEGDARRPTLFDFLAHRAFDHYTSATRHRVFPKTAPVAPPESPLFGDTAGFLAWAASGEIDADLRRPVALLRRLTLAHAGRPVPLAETTLTRLRWARRLAAGGVAEIRIREQLRALAESKDAGPVAVDARAELARSLLDAGEPGLARETALPGVHSGPGPVLAGEALCSNIVRDIEAPEAVLKAERVWTAPWPRITVVHKNLAKIHFRVVRSEWRDFLGADRGRPEWLNDREKQAVLAAAPAVEWSEELPAATDYKSRTDRLRVPENLPPGFYFLVASFDPSFSDKNNRILYTDFWVSSLAVVALGEADGKITGRVCEADSGEPVAGATVSGWSLEGRRERTPVPDALTDRDGRFTLNVPNHRGILLLARTADGRELGSMQEFSAWQTPRPPKPHNRITFFTDRAVFRPGQSVRFKGVVIRADFAELKHRPIAERVVTVALDDANGKEVARRRFTTNAYGAFDGEFEIPGDRLPGTYALHTTGNENGRAHIAVEEYKRPTFEVKLAEAKGERPVDTGRRMTVFGSASTYTDAPVDRAKVRWRVVKEESWPRWCWWRPATPPEEIAHGETTTDAKGAFNVVFDAALPARGRREASPVFTYTVTADVTDAAGETRAASRAVRVGLTDRRAEVTPLPAPGTYAVSVTGLDGGAAPGVSGKIVVRALKEPAYVHRAPPEDESGIRQQSHIARLAKHAHGGQLEIIGDEEAEDDSGVAREFVDLSNPANWRAGDTVAELPFTTDTEGRAKVAATGLKPGHYRVFVDTKDTAGLAVSACAEARVLPESGDRLGLHTPFVVEADTARDYRPGDTFDLRWGSGYDSARAHVEIFRRGKPTESFWTEAGKTLQSIRIPVTEADRGGLAVTVSQIRENRLYRGEARVKVPWDDKKLTVTREHFADKLKPGASETWTFVVRGPDGKPAPSSVVATLYDASLDAYRPLDWPENFGLWPDFIHRGDAGFLNMEKGFRWLRGEWTRERLQSPDIFRDWNRAIRPRAPGMFMMRTLAKGVMTGAAPMAASMSAESDSLSAGAPTPLATTPSLDTVSARTNLQETAFFLPRVETGEDGAAKFTFTVPESLTRWRFLAFAHDRELRTGSYEATAVTALDLMVKPNAPRFLREGDTVDLPVKLINRTDKPLSGSARLSFDEATTLRPMNDSLGLKQSDRTFTIPANGSLALTWRVVIPDGCGPLAYTVKAAADSGDADGEAGLLPVLPRRIQVVESSASSIAGPGETTVSLPAPGGSPEDPARPLALRVDTVARPAWYAVMALPYLMEYPHECSEQLFHRYYANAIAAHIAASDPKLRAVFDTWKNTPGALDSPLEKDAALKALTLEETPWVRDAEDESARRRRVGLLFDRDRLEKESADALRKLEARRAPDGGWSWFPGGPTSEWVTREIVLGIARLAELGVPTDIRVATDALPVLDRHMVARHEALKKQGADTPACDSEIAQTLQARAHFLSTHPIPEESREAYAFFTERAKSGWSTLDRASQARLALCLAKYGDAETPALVVKSLRERSVTGGDLGMRWNDAYAAGWLPWVAPVETRALMVEVFETVAKDPVAADACRLALLTDKRSNAWPTTTGTADACFALLMRGSDLLGGDATCAVSVNGKAFPAGKAEAGSGATSVSIPTAQIPAGAAKVHVKKDESGPAWVSVHRSYLLDSAKVKAHSGGAMAVRKSLFKKILTGEGPRLLPVSGNRVSVGDELVVRLEVTTDRDLDYVHIRDGRPGCVEPGITLSGYKWDGAIGYYEAVRDTATHRFFEHLPKGTHVFEFSTRADRRGVCRSGLTEVRCLYAPEFAAFGEAPIVTVE